MSNSGNGCPCGSGHRFDECCGPLLSGQRQAATAEQLMRSRYTAYTRADRDYLERTWHVSTRPSALQLDDEDRLRWLSLHILSSRKGGTDERKGDVEFEARYTAGPDRGTLHENSRFVKENGRWYYLDGQTRGTLDEVKVGRNAPCPCGSGRKYKRCCGR